MCPSNSQPTLYRTAYPFDGELKGFYTVIECSKHLKSEGNPMAWEPVDEDGKYCEICADEEIREYVNGR
jgi:hypothetical protein